MTRLLSFVAALALALLASTPGSANPYDPTAVNPVSPAPSNDVPGPTLVPGKEFSDDRDRDALGAADPEQVVLWDGAGGTADGFDYTGSRDPEEPGEVDALANGLDVLFREVHLNQTGLLFSVEGDSSIYFERTDGTSGTWATAPTIDGMNAINDLDALEVWGPDGFSDSNRYSLEGDPGLPGGARVAVWAYDSGLHQSTPSVLSSTIGTLIGLDDSLWDRVDVDGLMVNLGLELDALIFSVAPIIDDTGALIFDGGEIWHWDGAAATADFLEHGGHKWDTAFDVAGTFGLESENINAIEGASFEVPEPGTAALLLASLLGAWGVARRREV